MEDTKIISARVPAAIADALYKSAREPGDVSRFIRSAVTRAIKERERKRQARQAAAGEQEAAA